MHRSLRHHCRGSVLFLVVATVLLGACSSDETEPEAQAAAGPVRIEIVSLDHAPIRPATEEAVNVASEFDTGVTLSTFHFETPAGDELAAENGLTEHTPIVIFVNGETDFEIDGREVKFVNFPVGQGTGVVADGDWSIDDLRTVIRRLVSEQQGG